MQRRRWLLGALAVVALLAAVASADDPATTPRRGQVTILHTNDWHGYALPETPRKGKKGKKAHRERQGGVAAVAAAFARVRAEVGQDKVLALDAGDLLTGFPAAELAEEGVVGATFVKAWSAIGYDAFVIGNHDFDAGLSNARSIVRLSRAPCVVGNIFRTDDGSPALPAEPYKTFERGGLKISVLGLVTDDLARLTSAETMKGLKVFPLAEAARPFIDKLKKTSDLVVALTHAGVDADRELARAVPGIDVIVGGHSHSRLLQPVLVGHTIIVQAGCNGREYGRLDLTVEAGRVVSSRELLLPALVTDDPPPKEMKEPLARIEKHMEALRSERLGETTQPIPRGPYYGETLLGNFVADVIRVSAGADAAFINSGGLRADFPKGDVTRADLLKVVPSDNALVSFEVTGAELEGILRANARAVVTQDHGILQVSGLRYRWRRVGSGKDQDATIISVEVGGKPLERERKYTCATNDFIAREQASKYLGLTPKTVKPLGKTIQGALVEAFKHGPVELPDRGRIDEERTGAPAERGRHQHPDRPRRPDPEEPEDVTRTPSPAPSGAGKGDGKKDAPRNPAPTAPSEHGPE